MNRRIGFNKCIYTHLDIQWPGFLFSIYVYFTAHASSLRDRINAALRHTEVKKNTDVILGLALLRLSKCVFHGQKKFSLDSTHAHTRTHTRTHT